MARAGVAAVLFALLLGCADAPLDSGAENACQPATCDQACLTAGAVGGVCRDGGCTCLGLAPQGTLPPAAPPGSGGEEPPPREEPERFEPPAEAPQGQSPPPAVDGIPCAIQEIVTRHCGNCHGAEPRFGAPMTLTTLDALRQWSARVAARVSEVQRPMPPPPNARLEPAEQAALLGWLEQGAPAGTTCEEDAPPAEDMIPEVPPPEEDCDHVLELTAHGRNQPGDQSPYQVPAQRDSYVCFAFKAPWPGQAHALSFHPIVDDDRVLHHWLLYATAGDVAREGEIFDCNGRHPGMALVAGWAPGGTPAVMPPDVGQEVPPGPNGTFVLEIHYHNPNGLDAPDNSGVRICATETLRPNTAAVHWLGAERGPANILPFSVPSGRSEVNGRCTPRLNQPVNIISSTPHMHRRGVNMRSVIRRASGGSEVLIDEPFDFENQIIYQTPATIFPGDRIETTCTFQNPGGRASFGTSSDDEMCYNFVVAWPVGQLINGDSFVGAQHVCLQ